MAVKLELYKNDIFDSVISASTPNDGSYTWDTTGIVCATDYKVKVTDLDDVSRTDMSDGNFEIAPLPRVIFLQDIDNLRNNLSSNLTLDQDLDFNDDASYDQTDPDWATKKVAWTTGEGWRTIGDDIPTEFTGNFDGAGFTISNLYINRPTISGGLFGACYDSSFSNVGMLNVNITGSTNTGALVGRLSRNSPSITNCYSTGTVTGDTGIGGLVGHIQQTTMFNCYSTATVIATNQQSGGLVGNVGIENTVTKCYATGSVTSTNASAGGLTGSASRATFITDCYATGNVTAPMMKGGLIGTLSGGSGEVVTVTNCHSSGLVSGGGTYFGGLLGKTYLTTVVSSYYDTQTSGQSDTGKGTPKTTAQMKQEATFTNWNFSTIWDIVENVSYPTLL